MSLAWAAYRVAAPCLGMLAPAAGMFASPLERPLWRERLGDVTLPGGCHAWIHAASLGEAAAVAPLARELSTAAPDARLWLTASTITGRTRLQQSGRPVSLAPIDSPQATRRFLARVQPGCILLVETELWPHWLLRASAEGISVAVVSARLSQRSVGRYRSLGGRMRRLIGGLAGVLCQSHADERRWRAIGAPPEHTFVTGNLKSDNLPHPSADRRAERERLGLEGARPLLVLGSLRPGEPRLIARAWLALPASLREAWQVVAVPRHPRASEELAAEASAAGIQLDAAAPPARAWRWDDRTGALLDWYRAADVAFVGGSLTPFGGHNPLEPAACGAAVLMGPHHASQLEYVRALGERRGIWVVADAGELGVALARLLGDEGERRSRGQAAVQVALESRGAAARTVAKLAELGLWPR